MKIKLPLLPVLLLTALTTTAQIDFEENIISDYSHLLGNETSIAMADLDGDGDKDFLTNYGWYENDGQGNFGSLQQIVNAYGAESIYPTDMDQDGDTDFLVGFVYPEEKIAWYENMDGQATFGEMQIIVPSVTDLKMVYSKDLDQDGDMDVLSVSEEDKIAWYENTDGQETFGGQQIISMAQDATSVYAADLDGDGDNDILTSSFAHNLVAWHENLDGLGDFGAQQAIDYNGEGANSVIAKDLDGDGDQDVIAAIADPDPYDSEKITWYENDGQGNFYNSEFTITYDVDNPKAVNAEDVDNDGDLDVLSASSGDHKIAWYENLDGNTFGPQQIVTTFAYGANAVFSFDINDDGNKDILAGSAEDSKRTWYENDGTQNFHTENIIDISTGPSRARWVRSADMDGDNDKDVLYAAFGDNRIAWYKNTDGLGNFAPEKLISTFVNEPASVHPADVDGDNDMDVLSASFSDDKIAWYENDGQGNFGLQQIISTDAASAKSVFAADLDGDGDMDALSASRGDDKIAWYENTDGSGNFGAQQIISDTSLDANSVFATDLDNDGDQDVLTASMTDNIIAWHENMDGQGTFGPRQIITENADFAVSVYATDLDGDMDMDVLSASGGDNKIAWYENTDGEGNFGNQQIISTNEPAAHSVYAADLDNDGDKDVLCSNFNYPSGITWFENTNGAGDFGTRQVISTNVNGASSVFADDIDSDGDMDVLSSSSNIQGKITWYKNPINLSINEKSLKSFSIYPNPTSGILKINSKIPVEKIKILNNLGQLVLINSDQNQIDLSKLNDGIYFVKITGENGESEAKKIIKK